METLEGKAHRFHAHFKDLWQAIADSEGPEIFKKILILTLLDGVSRSVFPSKGNRRRFVDLVRQFGHWADAERVSLPHLLRLLEVVPDPAFEELRKWARGQLANWDFGRTNELSIQADPQKEKVLRYWPKGTEYRTPVKGVSVDQLTHAHLLYQERNHLIHEFREAGGGGMFARGEQPYYQEASSFQYSLDQPDDEWVQLVYPSGFHLALAETVLDELRDYFVRNQLNPFASYNFGNYWLQPLN